MATRIDRKIKIHCFSALSLAAVFHTACGSSKDDGSGGAAGTSSGGSSNGGGTTAMSGGKTGASGGVTTSGGSTTTAGTGASAGEVAGEAGATGTGGVASAEAGAGGAEAEAGSGNIAPATGGKSSGTGGKSGAGGASGGAANGGAASGGIASGGAANGGAASGGKASGGTNSSGGAANGGTASGGTASGGVGTGGGSSCGALGQACCAPPADSCGTDMTCLLGASCACVKGTFGTYVIRSDGIVLQEPTTAAGAQTPVLDANTALPLTGAVDGMDTAVWSGGAACMVRSDGTVWCWRSAANGNSTGFLGNGTTDSNGATFRATQVLKAANTPLTNVKSIDHIWPCAVTNDGKIYCWGDVSWTVNNGTTLISPYAQVITTDGATPLTGVIQVSNGSQSTCALVAGASSNEVWCWGQNGRYNLGTGDTTNRHYPTKIVGLTNPTAIAIAYANSYDSVCAIDGGNVLCWGYNGDGESGDGNTNTPVRVPTLVKIADGTTPLSGIIDLYRGYADYCAVHDGNTLWCWGYRRQAYANNTGLTNVYQVGDIRSGRYLTSDGVFHYGTVAINPKCGSLQ